MALNNFFFLPYLIIVLLVYYLASVIFKQSPRLPKILFGILVLSSYLFISFSSLYCSIILLFVSLIAYITPLMIEKYENKKTIIEKLTIAILLLILGVFKYYNFFVESFSWVGLNTNTIILFLPLGISFYIFSAISYIVDVARKKYIANKSCLETLLYMSFFPKLLAGPIVRADDFFKQLPNILSLKWKNIEVGIQIFAIGLFKKMVLADRLSVFVDDVFYAPVAFDGFTILWGVISYSLQIYFDFSGYSDMSIGVSKMFGFDFKDNFNFPYLAKNVTEFWKRWHISLSSWLQEYLYYSLGGNRKGKIRTYLNLFLTMLLGGLWHGAAWTFVAWGALHGLALIIHKLFMNLKEAKLGNKYATNSLWNIILVPFTYVFTSFCWIFFRASNFENAADVIKGIFSAQIGIVQPYTWTLFALIIFTIVHIKHIKDFENSNAYPIQDLSTIKGQTIFFTFCGLIVILAYVGNTAFIYGAF